MIGGIENINLFLVKQELLTKSVILERKQVNMHAIVNYTLEYKYTCT